MLMTHTLHEMLFSLTSFYVAAGVGWNILNFNNIFLLIQICNIFSTISIEKKLFKIFPIFLSTTHSFRM